MPLQPEDLAGLPDFWSRRWPRPRPSAGMAAVSSPSRQPDRAVPAILPRRDLRERAHRAWTARGMTGGASDKSGDRRRDAGAARGAGAAARLSRLRRLQARARDGQDRRPGARAPDGGLAAGAEPPPEADAARLEELMHGEGERSSNPRDWRYYSAIRQKREHDLDEAEIKPYLELGHMTEAAFDVAGRLFGLSFVPLDLPLYHPEARAWEVRRGGSIWACSSPTISRGRPSGLAHWCSTFRGQSSSMAGAAHRAQCLQLRQGAGRRADAAHLRRRAHPVPRIRPCAASAHVGRDLWLHCRDLGGGRFRGAAEPALRALAVDAGGCWRRMRGMPGPASRCRRRCSTGCSRRGYDRGFATVECSLRPGRSRFPRSGAGRSDGGAGGDARPLGLPHAVRCGMRRRISPMSSRAAAYASGCYSYMWSEVRWMPMPSWPFARPATFRSRHWPHGSQNVYSAGGSRDAADCCIRGACRRRGAAGAARAGGSLRRAPGRAPVSLRAW